MNLATDLRTALAASDARARRLAGRDPHPALLHALQDACWAATRFVVAARAGADHEQLAALHAAGAAATAELNRIHSSGSRT